MEIKKITLPEGWEIDNINGNEIILKEAKKWLPDTWEGCAKKLKIGEFISTNSEIYCTNTLKYGYCNNKNVFPKGLAKSMLALMQLLVCREVYRQGWKPDWKKNNAKYCIECYNGDIRKSVYCNVQRILSFQTSKICDKFFENFRNLIEEAKELI